jgi:Tannase-like family of unknown function (DUF6351)
MMIRCLPARVCLSVCAAGVVLSACGDNGGNAPDAGGIAAPGPVLQIKTLSNRADLVSGGDVLVEVIIPGASPTGTVHVFAGTRDVSSAFARRSDGRTIGLITGLDVGPTQVKADLDGKQIAVLTVTNHPIGGPVFSGPQIQPWICATPGGQPPTPTDPGSSPSGLPTGPTDAQCNAATDYQLYYRTTESVPTCTLAVPDPTPLPTPLPNFCFKKYDPAAPPAAIDIATTTTDAGVAVPYIVRVERGTLNRGIFDIAVLFDPTQGSKTSWTATAPQTTWNHKLLYVFGPATGQPRFQLRSSQSWAGQDEALKRGFLVAVNSMTDSALNSNRTTMTETLMMMKEHVIDGYGELRYAIGAGCSGGSINQLTSSSIYPGLLDGIQPSCTYPDSETTGMEVGDCEQLVRFYASAKWTDLMTAESQTVVQNNAKQAAINGHLDQTGCRSWFNSFIGVARPGNYLQERVGADGTITTTTVTNNCRLPASMVYDPVTNPNGPRCTGQDHAVSIWGKVPGTNRAPSTRDNVGIVYGLKAFLSGAINGEELVTLNENIGGSDFDIVHTDARSVADAFALPIAYKTGIIMDGKQLAKTPIIDVRGYDESGIHYIWRSFSLRARLDAAGGHGNHVLWRFPTALTPPAASGLTLASFLAMDKWLTTMRADTSGAALEQRIVADKPAEGFDFCYLSADTAFATKIQDMATCDLDPRLAPHSSPRQVAGGPVTENILKCQLKPFAAADYPGLTEDQLTRLAAVFPSGVCDWSKPGVGQAAAQSPRDFTAGPGGAAFPAAPASKAL